jgi:hypothetical protein
MKHEKISLTQSLRARRAFRQDKNNSLSLRALRLRNITPLVLSSVPSKHQKPYVPRTHLPAHGDKGEIGEAEIPLHIRSQRSAVRKKSP